MPIGPDMTAGELHDLLARRGAALMVRALAALERGSLHCTPQAADGVTYATKIDKAEAPHRFHPAGRARCTTTSAACRRSPAPGSRSAAGTSASASRCCAPRWRLEWQGSAGTVLDDKLTIACGEGAVRLLRGAARRQAADAGGRVPARLPAAAGTQL